MKDEIYLNIEKYLAGVMSTRETLEFEAEVKNDSELAHSLKLATHANLHQKGGFEDDFVPNNEYTKNLRNFLRSEEAKRLREQLEVAKRTYANHNTTTNRRKFPYWIAASIVVLIICGIGFYHTSQQTPEKLYATYYSETDLPSVIQRNDIKGILKNGVVAFKNEDYNVAVEYFNSFQNENQSSAAYLYSGMAYVELGNLPKAVSQFNSLINSDSIDASKGYWFKALAYLKFEDEENAKNVLNLIAANPAFFKYNEAKQLLDKL